MATFLTHFKRHDEALVKPVPLEAGLTTWLVLDPDHIHMGWKVVDAGNPISEIVLEIRDKEEICAFFAHMDRMRIAYEKQCGSLPYRPAAPQEPKPAYHDPFQYEVVSLLREIRDFLAPELGGK